MDWDDLRYLLAAERTGSIAGAAKQLGVTKATASRRLAALEESLGARLFERTRDGLTLTPAGSEALDAARGIEDDVATLADRVQSSADSRVRGMVRVTTPPWIADRLVIPALPELQQRYPELEVQLAASNALLNLGEREADIAVRNVRPTQKSLAVRKLVDLGGCVYASGLYLERRGTPQSRDQLGGHDLLAYATLGGMPGFEWMGEPIPNVKIAFRSNDPVALVGAASAGLGMTAVPCMLGDAEGSLQRVTGLGFARCELFLVVADAVRRAARVRVTSEFLVEVIQRNRRLIEG